MNENGKKCSEIMTEVRITPRSVKRFIDDHQRETTPSPIKSIVLVFEL